MKSARRPVVAAADVRPRAARPSWTTTFRSRRGTLGGETQGSQLGRRLVGRAVMEGAPAGGASALHVGQSIVDEDRVGRPKAAHTTRELEDRAIGLGTFYLAGHDVVAEQAEERMALHGRAAQPGI